MTVTRHSIRANVQRRMARTYARMARLVTAHIYMPFTLGAHVLALYRGGAERPPLAFKG